MTTPNRVPQRLERPVVAVVGLDPALVGNGGLCVMPVKSGPLATRQGPILSTACFRWLGDTVAAVCPPGSRTILVAEKDAFGPSIGRSLGIAIGAVEGLLIDLNAAEPGTRVDVASRTWRTHAYGRGNVPKGRGVLKRLAVQWARERFGLELGADAAEAVGIALYGAECALPEWPHASD